MTEGVASEQEDSDSLEWRAWRSLADTYKIVHNRVNSDLRQYGLTQPQYSVLRVVGKSESGSLAMSEIGRILLVTYADVTMIVDNLEKRNLLKRVRVSHDRRVVRVELTPTGLALWRKIRAIHRRKVAGLMSGLSTRELKELTVSTDKIRARILKVSDDDERGRQRTSLRQRRTSSRQVVRA